MQSKVGLSFIAAFTSSELVFSASRTWNAASVTIRLAVPSRLGSTLSAPGAAWATDDGVRLARAAAGAEAVNTEILSQMDASCVVLTLARTALRSGPPNIFWAASVIGRTVFALTLSLLAVLPASLRRDLPQATSWSL